tara:strand:+ start:876 stop:1070 length:195 start_codon:yes stop_codon:yes gene_type:complete
MDENMYKKLTKQQKPVVDKLLKSGYKFIGFSKIGGPPPTAAYFSLGKNTGKIVGTSGNVIDNSQ